ncbi:hypothetical protein [Streptomyces sp. NPDC021356]|uniref:hypothetical protein n=1 Tax=Streptomyces sp. NPDC021356 TaxID=3154900 RepID=UPI0033E1CC74
MTAPAVTDQDGILRPPVHHLADDMADDIAQPQAGGRTAVHQALAVHVPGAHPVPARRTPVAVL